MQGLAFTSLQLLLRARRLWGSLEPEAPSLCINPGKLHVGSSSVWRQRGPAWEMAGDNHGSGTAGRLCADKALQKR